MAKDINLLISFYHPLSRLSKIISINSSAVLLVLMTIKAAPFCFPQNQKGRQPKEVSKVNKELYFKELGIVLSRSGFTALPEQDGFLPVEYEGRPLCRVDATGSVFYHQDIALDEIVDEHHGVEPYATLTVSFGEFIGLKNSAYIDTNNCRFAQQLLNQGIVEDTGLRKSSGFCEYPLWTFKQEFLEEIGGENYAEYSRCYDAYMKAVEERLSAEENFDPAEHTQDGMTMQ